MRSTLGRIGFGIGAACAFGVGCNPARVPLWPDQATVYHVGTRWQRGVAPSGRQRFEAKGSGYVFRACALAPATLAGEVRLEGALGSQTWRLAPGGADDLEWTVPSAGTYSVIEDGFHRQPSGRLRDVCV